METELNQPSPGSELKEPTLVSEARFPAALVLVLAAVLLATQIGPWWHSTPDAVAYLSIARGFAEGHVQRLGEPQLYFAPGYPLLISPAFLVGDRPFLLISLMHWAFAVLVLIGVYRWATAMTPRLASAVIAAAVVLNATFWLHLRPTLSETAFMAAWIWTVLAMRALLGAGNPRVAAALGLSSAMLLMMTTLIRHAGIFLGPALVVGLLIDAHRGATSWRRAIAVGSAVCMPAVVAIVLLVGFDRAAAAGNTTYLDQVLAPKESLLGQINEGLRQRVSSAGQLLIPFMHKDPSSGWLDANMLLYLPLVAVLAMGWCRMVKRTADVFAIAAPFYIALYVLWPYSQGARFMQPLLPLLYICLWQMLEPLNRRMLVLYLLAALHASVAIREGLGDIRDAREHARLWPQVDAAASLIPEPRPTVASVAVRSEAHVQMLELAMDRKTEEYSAMADLPPTVHWVLVGPTVPLDTNFSIRQHIGASRLLQRSLEH